MESATNTLNLPENPTEEQVMRIRLAQLLLSVGIDLPANMADGIPSHGDMIQFLSNQLENGLKYRLLSDKEILWLDKAQAGDVPRFFPERIRILREIKRRGLSFYST